VNKAQTEDFKKLLNLSKLLRIMLKHLEFCG